MDDNREKIALEWIRQKLEEEPPQETPEASSPSPNNAVAELVGEALESEAPEEDGVVQVGGLHPF